MKITESMINDAIRGARNELKNLKQSPRNQWVDTEIGKARKRLSKYGAIKEKMGWTP